jgi:hypothetical protein
MEVTGRLFLCARCRVQVHICSPCDHGQIYCAGGCSQISRHASVCEAGRRYQRTRKGRFAHAERSRRYRQRQQNVTHQGSLVQPPDDLLPVDSAVAIAAPQASGTPPTPSTLQCQFCGVRCSAFVRLGYLGGRVPRNVRQHNRRGSDHGHSP